MNQRFFQRPNKVDYYFKLKSIDLFKSKASTPYIRIGIQFVLIKETITVLLAFEILLIMELKLRKNLDLDDLKSNVILYQIQKQYQDISDC